MNRAPSVDSGFESNSSKNSTLTSNSSLHCPVWSWKVDRMWTLQQKLEKQKSVANEEHNENEGENTDYFMESLKFGANLQSNFLPSSMPKPPKVKTNPRNENDIETKSLYMFDYDTKKSNYLNK